MGTNGLDDGIIPMALSDIFERKHHLLQDGAEVHVNLSCVQVYNNKLKDMLCLPSEGNQDEVRLFDKANGETIISGLRNVSISTISEAQKMLRRAAASRKTGSHAVNELSSRSHAVYVVTVQQQTVDGVETVSKLHLVDLAGSESVRHSGSEGDKVHEAGKVNQSLVTLLSVIQAVYRNQEKEQEAENRSTGTVDRGAKRGRSVFCPEQNDDEEVDDEEDRENHLRLRIASNNDSNNNSSSSSSNNNSASNTNGNGSGDLMRFSTPAKSKPSTARTVTATNRKHRVTPYKSSAQATASKPERVPYRDSKLTRILKDTFGGNGLIVLIVCISPYACNVASTLEALRFAKDAAVIRNKPQVNAVHTGSQQSSSAVSSAASNSNNNRELELSRANLRLQEEKLIMAADDLRKMQEEKDRVDLQHLAAQSTITRLQLEIEELKSSAARPVVDTRSIGTGSSGGIVAATPIAVTTTSRDFGCSPIVIMPRSSSGPSPSDAVTTATALKRDSKRKRQCGPNDEKPAAEWTDNLDAALKNAHHEFKGDKNVWIKVSRKLGNVFSHQQCQSRFLARFSEGQARVVKSIQAEQLMELVMRSHDERSQVQLLNTFIECFRKRVAKNVPIATLIEIGAPEFLTGMFTDTSNSNALVHKAVEALNNIVASSSHDELQCVLQRCQCVPRLVSLVSSDHRGTQEQALWVLCNIALDESGAFRKQLMEEGALETLMEVVNKGKLCMPAAEWAAKLLGAFTMKDGLQLPEHSEWINLVVSVADSMLSTAAYAGKEVETHFLIGALCFLTEGESRDMISVVCGCERIVARLVSVLSGKAKDDLLLVAVDTMSHLAAGNKECVATLLSANVLCGLRNLVTHTNDAIVATACRCLSNMCAGHAHVIQEVQSAGLFPTLIQFVSDGATSSTVRFYASYALMFSLYGADVAQTQYLIDSGVVPLLFGILAQYTADSSNEERDVTLEALQSLKMLLFKFDHVCDFERVCAVVTEAQGWGLLEEMARSADDEEVRQLAGELTVERITAEYVKQEEQQERDAALVV